jgi:hypothetical protein
VLLSRKEENERPDRLSIKTEPSPRPTEKGRFSKILSLFESVCVFSARCPLPVSHFVLCLYEYARSLLCGVGGVGAFVAAWFRPDLFGCVATHCGTYVNIRGGHNLPWVVRNTPRKPLRVFLQSGENDLRNNHGSWPLANWEMAEALTYADYGSTFVFGKGGHSLTHGGRILGETLQWLFHCNAKAPPGAVMVNTARL